MNNIMIILSLVMQKKCEANKTRKSKQFKIPLSFLFKTFLDIIQKLHWNTKHTKQVVHYT